MYVLERDQYADTHLRSGPRLRFWLLWLLATGVSFFVAHLIAQVPDQAEQFGGLLYWGFLVARGAAFGVVIGAAQGLVLLMYVRKSAWPQWVLASALGWAVRALFLYFISD